MVFYIILLIDSLCQSCWFSHILDHIWMIYHEKDYHSGSCSWFWTWQSWTLYSGALDLDPHTPYHWQLLWTALCRMVTDPPHQKYPTKKRITKIEIGMCKCKYLVIPICNHAVKNILTWIVTRSFNIQQDQPFFYLRIMFSIFLYERIKMICFIPVQICCSCFQIWHHQWSDTRVQVTPSHPDQLSHNCCCWDTD